MSRPVLDSGPEMSCLEGLRELISARNMDSYSPRSTNVGHLAPVRSIFMKRRIVLLIGGISEPLVSRFLLGAAVVKVKRERVQIDARRGGDAHCIIAARGSLSWDNLCTED